MGSGPELSILDGSGSEGSCVSFVNGEGADAVLVAFQITGGSGTNLTPSSPRGGGILILNSEPTILRNRLFLNVAVAPEGRAGAGGGIFMLASEFKQPRIQENTIMGNSGINGGGIVIGENTAPLIIGNNFLGNRAVDGDGGGIFISTNVPGTMIENNNFVESFAWDKGGAIYAAAVPEVTVTGNRFLATWARGMHNANGTGGVLWCRDSNIMFVQNTLRRTKSSGGGAITMAGNSRVALEKNILAEFDTGAALVCIQDPDLQLLNNLFWQVGEDIEATCTNLPGLATSLFENPLFCNEAWFTSLAENSPALLHPDGVIGAEHTAGCLPVALRSVSWGALKTKFK